MTQRIPGWAVDILLAIVFAGVGWATERLTSNLLSDVQIWAGVGLGSFALLRLGALFARAGRTLGCLFVFAMTWVLPCAAVFFVLADYNRQVIAGASAPFFILLGFLLIAIMVITFERLRQADEVRFAAGLPAK